MKIAKIEKSKDAKKGHQHGYHILIFQIRYVPETIEMNDIKIFESFVSASAKEGEKELSKALLEISKLGIS